MTKEILDLLDNYPAFLATKGTCGNPRVRPIKSALFKDGKLYFCTSKKKNLYKHMQNFSGIEISAFNGKDTWIRIRGEADFSQDLEIKKAMFLKYPEVKEIYKDVENEDFAIFFIKNPSIKIQDFNGRDEVIKA
ncbi:pyridoxamine 5'-phosphate oxidase [Helicobacter valdiviensis]|uniref:Pyridoxamine 5'-phosphate oxidase n=1 Tax=Helicobacter valdiviensis TaxID=1458358 RepID=A0A2W6MVS1_9HELI|nr:pyridoxamine 5'-phosphate oxidase family protein [Helicobacter valdiviensis]PZT48061.1 pyridoxamine 5'-phosphate oxidase [Helicobacter valdiviensis]